ncbi:flagellum-specific ATP synthase FliI [Paucibacter aquatile]|uniref:Flagellum-specific ATP synthase FliI n=1 Tax=Kinneretia aquatilis TaxID=2070761 RepID=A0A2N8L0E7_9BURK|nr:FliI/YscN family ATPase [Paucibacter aquatile]PND39161.1 flagellum-specific ATP synthase FliI [Paucibacter aquatile]
MDTATLPAAGARPTAQLLHQLQHAQAVAEQGRVVQALGTLLRVRGLRARIGQSCRVFDPARPEHPALCAEVVAYLDGELLLAPFGSLQGLPVGALVQVAAEQASLPCGAGLLGRVLDSLGEPMDGRPLPAGLSRVPLMRPAPHPLTRRMVSQPFCTGVRAIDALLTVGEGQRVGVFAMAGGGKSTLLGMLARHARADVNVIALIGERGREVREFIEDALGPEGLARSVLVVSTSERPALERARAALAATALAEGFRAQGQRVLLMMDSVTRHARALRELGLSAGEPPVRRGYPPSVFAELPQLFERAGNDDQGSITAFYTVLAEDEDGEDPIAEEVRSILDGHVLLSRKLAQQQHYPAIDVLASVSRVFQRVTTPEQQAQAAHLRRLLARHAEVEFLLRVGEYRAGADPLADEAIARLPQLQALLRQPPLEASRWEQTQAALREALA